MEYGKILEILESLENKKVLILMHHNADIDALSSAIVLKNFLEKKNNVDIGVSESVARQCRKIQEITKVDVVVDPDCKNYDFVISVDTSSKEQLKTIKNLKIDIVIDHHEKGDLEGNIETFVVEDAKSTTAVIYEMLKDVYEFSEIDKKLILAGLLSDTSHLRFADKKVFGVFYDLLNGIKFSEILDLVSTEEDVSDKVVTIKAAKRMDAYKFENNIILAITWAGSHEAIVAKNLLKIGIDIAIVSTKKGDELRISSRGKEKILKYGLNLAELFREVGKFINGSGGGHDLAGSANGKPVKFQDLEKFILKKVSEKLGKYKKIKF